MKNIIYILLLFAQAALPQSFDGGNKLYRKGDYKGAAQQYENILKQGKESAEVYFNLGNAYYKMDSVAPAVYNYEKALQVRPGYRDAEVNLGFAQKMVIDDIKAVPKVGFNKMLYNITGTYHYNTWAWIAVSFAVVFFLLFLGYYFSGITLLKRIFFTGMFLALFGILTAILSAFFVRSHENAQHPAIIFAEVATVKAEPRNNAQDAFILHAGTKVNVTETLEGYYKIRLADESVGWIEKGAVKEIK